MTLPAAAPIRLADYRPPDWSVHHAELGFDLDPDRTLVRAQLRLQQAAGSEQPLRLQGEELELLRIILDDRALTTQEYRYADGVLEIPSARGHCVLETLVAINPRGNTRLEGLYCSGPMLLTQCEAEGFRRITFFIDRPDVLSSFRVELRAQQERYPVLLANGNPGATGALPDGRHFARWDDPFPKPSYLFAIAAGAIERVSQHFSTAEGRAVEVNVWAEPADVARCQYALEATLRAMRWDEQRWGRCYDLAVFNIVAAQDFTMGAMENKGLNIFNARYILADPESATDADYEAIEAVIGHEYFHNWSGNRVTLRDWFQLSLKEGLTVFRDQEFTSDLRSRGVKRIADVRGLRARQWVEDAGPLAHPVRPQEYREINNFYTATVYEKGAELIRLIHTLIGEAAFRAGLDQYFAAHDGHAATVEDLLTAMQQASGRDLSPLLRWYDQAGTPRLRIREQFDGELRRYRLSIEQQTPATPGQTAKQPLLIPLAFAFYDADDRPLAGPLQADCGLRPGLLELTEPHHTLTLENVEQPPLPAFLHALSAPVRLDFAYRPEQLARLVRVEADPLIRWDAMQRLAFDAITERRPQARDALLDAAGSLLADPTGDPAFVAECLLLPDIATLADGLPSIDIDNLLREREDLLESLAEAHADAAGERYETLAAIAPASLEPAAAAARRLKNVLLGWLTRLDPAGALAERQFAGARTATDRLAALNALIHFDCAAAGVALAEFRRRWAHDPLMTDKWIGILLSRPDPEALDDLQALLVDASVWQPANPNRVRAVLGTLARANPYALHRRDGAGYTLLCRQILQIDALNPQVAARLATAFEAWTRFDPQRRQLMQAQLQVLAAQAQSRDLGDVAGRLLGG